MHVTTITGEWNVNAFIFLLFWKMFILLRLEVRCSSWYEIAPAMSGVIVKWVVVPGHAKKTGTDTTLSADEDRTSFPFWGINSWTKFSVPTRKTRIIK